MYTLYCVSCMTKKELKTSDKLSFYAYEKCCKSAKNVY